MREAIHHIESRARLLLLAVGLLFCCVPAAHALRSPMPLPTLDQIQPASRLKEESAADQNTGNSLLQKTASFEKVTLAPENPPLGAKSRMRSKGPFGNLLSISGPLAAANHYRFSSKEVDPLSGDYYFGFRFYAPNLQRWRNRDPIGLWGGWDPHVFVGNDPMNSVDPDGLWGIQIGSLNFGCGNPSYVFDRQVWGEIKEGWHNGLDAIGTLDPTPTADAINSLFYVGEGEYRDAALTAAGMLPYFGDSMKLLKRGKKLCKAAKKTSQIDRAAFKAEREAFWKAEAKRNPGKYSPEDLAKMERGRAPTGPDDHPVELHHKDRTPTGGLDPMSRSDHRLGENYKKNHP